MKKKTATPDMSWDITTDTPAEAATASGADSVEWTTATVAPAAKQPKKVTAQLLDSGYDMEGLMTDFPTATELQRFVYDQTGRVLNLKGRANKLKYQVAMEVLNGAEPDAEFVGSENPYHDRTELVPHDPAKVIPARDPDIARAGPETNVFDTNLFPHPDPDLKAQGQNCQVRFVKYASGMITYEILGPVFQRAVGEKINKYGKLIPEKYTYVDPRGGEQVIIRNDGSITPLGTKIRGFMRRQRMNNSNMWDVWVDRELVVREEFIDDNPWSVV